MSYICDGCGEDNKLEATNEGYFCKDCMKNEKKRLYNM